MTVEERLQVQKIMHHKEVTLCNEQVNKWVLETLHFLTGQIFASGNTLPALGSATDKYVTWAHGAAGAIHTFIEAHKVKSYFSINHFRWCMLEVITLSLPGVQARTFLNGC